MTIAKVKCKKALEKGCITISLDSLGIYVCTSLVIASSRDHHYKMTQRIGGREMSLLAMVVDCTKVNRLANRYMDL